MASGVFSSIQSLSTNLLHAIRGTTSTSHQQDPPSPVRKDLEKLSRMLPRIQAVLQDAEEREIHDCSVRLWLAELRDVAYKAEDVLDEFYYEVLRSIVEGGDASIEAYHRDGGTTKKCAEMYTSSSLASYPFTISKAPIPDGMTEKIKGITEKLEEIANDRHALQLREEDGTRLNISPQIRLPTSSHVDKRTIFGREEEKDKIISLLDPSNGPDFMVLPIVGMGGFGKTTLAQLVYIDSRIHGWFNKRCWVSVSDDFDLVRLTKAIVESVSDNPCEFSELSKLQDVLMERIRDIGLFLVLDDVWNEKRNFWECFRVGLSGAKFVRILTTTRNTPVAKIMQTTLPFQLSSLPEENCWSIFKHFAFDNRVISENANLHEIGRGIVKKCKGSPLATKVLGGILRYETNEEKWREILESDISEIDKTGEIMPALRLSYEKLPRNLKPCFLYLSMFPKDTQFSKDMVVRLWIAQGYINGNTRNLKTLEAIGSEYFDELQCRSLVDGGPSNYILHDLIHDLARSVSQEAYRPILENDQKYNGACKVYHLYFPEEDELWGSFLVPNDYCSIRTFVARSRTMNSAFFYKIACVRTLHLHFSSLPNTLGTLKHLRYLYINGINIHLPESLCVLYHLQTLDMNCHNIIKLPENIKTLVNLQFLRLCCNKIKQLPESLCVLYHLQTLDINCNDLAELPENIKTLVNLQFLRLCSNKIKQLPESLCLLYHLQTLDINCNDLAELPENIKTLANLQFLRLCSNKIKQLPESLCLLYHLQTLDINCNDLAELPENIKTLVNLQFLRLCSNKIKQLPESLCLLYHLQTLDINCNDIAELPENIKTLVNLQFLRLCSSKIKQLPESISLLHNLHTLSIKRCPILEKVPKGTEKLTKLRVKLPENCICILPCGIGILTNLRNLSGNFIMGEFGDMNWLSGLMSISGLKNVGNIEYSRKANLISKSNLHKLILNFEEDDVACRNFLRDRYGDKFYYITISSSTNAKNENDEKIQEGVLESLQPHGNLIELVILNYGEIRVPYWLLDPSLMSELTTLTLHFHTELTFLPPLMDQLPHLKSLKIFGSVTKVRYDHLARSTLFANDSSKQCAAGVSFSSREKPFSSYIFYLVEWQAVDEPGLKKLIIKNCSKLREVTIPQKVDVLEVNKCGCQEIKFSSPSELKKLSISDCRELITIYYKSGDLPFLESISISGCPNLSILSAIPQKVEVFEVNACGCQEIKFSSPSELKKLSISKCRELITIYYKIGDLPFLENISLSGCPKLSMLSAIPPKVEALKLNTCGCKEIKFSSPSELKRLSISDCRELISIYYKIGDLHFLENISLSGCPKLSMLSAIPPKVEALKLNTCCCKEIKFSSPSELRKLSISNCRELITIDYKSGDLPFLKSISLSGCSKLSILPPIPQELEQLYVANCGIQEINFLSLSKLKNISIFRCRELVSIYYKIGDLPFLESISLSGCPKLLIFSAILEEMKQMHKRNSGFQSEIQNVSISDCGIRKIILPSRCWLLEIHNCLELISVHWRDGDSSSLPLVKFVDCPQLKLLKIPKEVEILQIKSCGTHEISFSSQSKVRRVDIHHCPELFSVLWMDGAIPFLKDLFIEGCPALRSILVVPNKKHQLGITECGLHEIQFPNQCKIASVHRSCCPELISLQFLQGDLPLLEKFAIKSCPQFHEVLTIPYQLKELKIVDCQFPEIHLLPQSNLRRLIIRDCSNLTAIRGLQAQFPTGDLLPPMMERVDICNCPRMDFGTQGNSYFYQVMHKASQDLLMFPSRANDHESGGSHSQDSEHAATQRPFD